MIEVNFVVRACKSTGLGNCPPQQYSRSQCQPKRNISPSPARPTQPGPAAHWGWPHLLSHRPATNEGGPVFTGGFADAFTLTLILGAEKPPTPVSPNFSLYVIRKDSRQRCWSRRSRCWQQCWGPRTRWWHTSWRRRRFIGRDVRARHNVHPVAPNMHNFHHTVCRTRRLTSNCDS